MHLDDSEKDAFTTSWVTFMCHKMPFGLINVDATFQRATDNSFVGKRDRFIVIYLDDMAIFSKSYKCHIKHLKHIPNKGRKIVLES